jgi:hypothetical protein
MKSKRSFPKLSNTSTNILSNKIVLYISFFFAIVTAANYLLRSNFEAVGIFIIIGFLTTYFSKNMIIVLLTTTILTNFIVMVRNRQNSGFIEGMTTEEIEAAKKAMEAAKKAMDDETDPTKKADLEKKYKDAQDAYNKAKETQNKPASMPNNTSTSTTSSTASSSSSSMAPPNPTSVGSQETVSMGTTPANEVQQPLSGKSSVKDGMSQLKPASINGENMDPMMQQVVPGMATGYNAQKEQAFNALASLGGTGGQGQDLLSQQNAMINNLKSIEPILNTAQSFLDKFENSSISKMFSGGLSNLPGMSLLTGGGGAGAKPSPAPVSSQ